MRGSRSPRPWQACALSVLIVIAAGLPGGAGAQPPPAPRMAVPAAPEVAGELGRLVAAARERFEARDAGGVLAYVSEQYRSAGLTKAAVRQQLLAMFALYEELRAHVTVERVDVVDGATWVYTTGEISGRLPMMGWVSVLAWEREPEVVRREGARWRLVGFQD